MTVSQPHTFKKTEPEIHIAGILLQVRRGTEPAVCAGLSALPHTEICAAADGKIVVVCEGSGSEDILKLLARMRELSGVVNVALVYQHAESAAAMEEKIGYDTNSP